MALVCAGVTGDHGPGGPDRLIQSLRRRRSTPVPEPALARDDEDAARAERHSSWSTKAIQLAMGGVLRVAVQVEPGFDFHLAAADAALAGKVLWRTGTAHRPLVSFPRHDRRAIVPVGATGASSSVFNGAAGRSRTVRATRLHSLRSSGDSRRVMGRI